MRGSREEMLGIQVEFQIGREDDLRILLQAPLEMKERVFRMHFHSHKEEEKDMGGEKGARI
jgi:hypothetical protein